MPVNPLPGTPPATPPIPTVHPANPPPSPSMDVAGPVFRRRPPSRWRAHAWLGLALVTVAGGWLAWRTQAPGVSPVPSATSPAPVAATPAPRPFDANILAEPAPLARREPAMLPARTTATRQAIRPPAADPWARPAGMHRDADAPASAPTAALDPDAWQAGNRLMANGQWLAAAAAYQRAYASAPDPALAHNLALALSAAGRPEAAQRWQQRADAQAQP